MDDHAIVTDRSRLVSGALTDSALALAGKLPGAALLLAHLRGT